MRPVRVIHLDNLRYKYISVTQSETKMVVRVLSPIFSDRIDTLPGGKILTTEKLKFKPLFIEDKYYQVIGEGVFDLNNSLHRSWFQSGTNICFCVNGAFSNGDLSIIPMNMFAAGEEKTPDWARRLGLEVIAQLYPWSDTDTILESPCSFAVDHDGKIFTNIDQNRLVHVDRNWMQRPDRSDFLCIKYSVKQEISKNIIKFKLKCHDYLGNDLAINGNYYVDCNCGYIPFRNIKFINGDSEFSWVPLYLSRDQLKEVNITLYNQHNYKCFGFSFKVN